VIRSFDSRNFVPVSSPTSGAESSTEVKGIMVAMLGGTVHMITLLTSAAPPAAQIFKSGIDMYGYWLCLLQRLQQHQLDWTGENPRSFLTGT
jgi:hypothetical protein